jgi:signal peptidase I
MYSLNWFLHKHVRQATDLQRQVTMLLNEQRDLLPPEKISNLQTAIAAMEGVLRTASDKKTVIDEMNRLEKVANDNLRPYPAAAIRENLKEVMVAITTIMAFTSFFLQLTKIPTGSMQPTLFGITDENLLDQNPAEKIPGELGRIKDYWVHGWQYNYFIAPEDGEFEDYAAPQTILPFVKKQRFRFAGAWYTITFPGEGLFGSSETGHGNRAIIRRGLVKKGEYVFAMKIIAGDHLLVDRFTYNFRRPKRGEIIVFKTRGIEGIQQDQLYIKRLVGLPGEKIQVGDDRHLVINDRRIPSTDRHFEMVYSFDDKSDPLVLAKTQEDWLQAMALTQNKPPYRGHVNDKVARSVFHDNRGIAPLFPDANASFQIGATRYMAMGDNTMNSLDSRVWGDFDQKNLIGKCWFVYWPFTDRFGWGYR